MKILPANELLNLKNQKNLMHASWKYFHFLEVNISFTGKMFTETIYNLLFPESRSTSNKRISKLRCDLIMVY